LQLLRRQLRERLEGICLALAALRKKRPCLDRCRRPARQVDPAAVRAGIGATASISRATRRCSPRAARKSICACRRCSRRSCAILARCSSTANAHPSRTTIAHCSACPPS
jgi:hypothetical protein